MKKTVGDKSVMPKVSFVMSVYNCEKYVGDTIQSVIEQTYSDWEFIIIDDNSSDNSAEIIKSFYDPRIVFIHNENNKGQSENLNTGIRLAKGEYIARLDHDDICMPNRIERQLKFMEGHPDVAICGCKTDYLEEGTISQIPEWFYETSYKEQLFLLSFDCVLPAHSTYFIRKSVMTENDIWYRNMRFCEDYALLVDMLPKHKIEVLDDVLVQYRVFPEQTTQTCGNEVISSETYECQKRLLSKLDFDKKEVLISSIEGNVRTMKQIREMENTYDSFVVWCGLENSERKILTSLQHKLFMELYMKQKKTIGWYLFLPFSKYGIIKDALYNKYKF